jgi:adenosylcobyric acid synthase
VEVRFTSSPAEVVGADLAVLPGTKATVADLAGLRARGLDVALAERARRGLPTLGICGGYQMLGERIVDRGGVESTTGEVAGLGLLPVETRFAEEKVLGRLEGRAPLFGDARVWGYEIRHGRPFVSGGEALLVRDGGEPEGCRVGEVYGASPHGLFESDGFRRAFLSRVAAVRGLDWVPGDGSFADIREARLDALGDLVAENVDREALVRLLEDGAPSGMPILDGGRILTVGSS